MTLHEFKQILDAMDEKTFVEFRTRFNCPESKDACFYDFIRHPEYDEEYSARFGMKSEMEKQAHLIALLESNMKSFEICEKCCRRAQKLSWMALIIAIVMSVISWKIAFFH